MIPSIPPGLVIGSASKQGLCGLYLCWLVCAPLLGQYAPRLRLEAQAGYSLMTLPKTALRSFPSFEETQTGQGYSWQLSANRRLSLHERLFIRLKAGQHSWFDWRATGNLMPEKMPLPASQVNNALSRSGDAFRLGLGIDWLPFQLGSFEPWLSAGLCYQSLRLEQAPRTLRVEGQLTRYVWQETGFELGIGHPGLRLGAGFNYHFSPLFYASLRAHAQGNWQGQTELLPATFGQFDATLGLGFRLFPSPSRFR